MGNALRHQHLLLPGEIEELAESTGFTQDQVVRLYNRFLTLDRQQRGALFQSDMYNIPELIRNPLGRRIVDAAFFKRDDLNAQTITFSEFLSFLAIFRPTNSDDPKAVNSRAAKLKFSFWIFDTNDLGYLTKAQFAEVLHLLVGSQISDGQVQHVCDAAIKAIEWDENGRLSFENYCALIADYEIDDILHINFLD